MSGAPGGGLDTDFSFMPLNTSLGPQTGGTRSTPWGRSPERGGLGSNNAAADAQSPTAGGGDDPQGGGGNSRNPPRGNLRGSSPPDPLPTQGPRHLERDEFGKIDSFLKDLPEDPHVLIFAYDDQGRCCCVPS